MEQLIKVLVADNHPLMRHVIRHTFKYEDDMMVVAEATDGAEAVNLAKEVAPDVILMDIDMPKKNGITATREIMNGKNKPRVIGFSASINKSIRRNLLEAGAVAFLSKSDIKILSATIRRELLMSSEPKYTELENRSGRVSKSVSAMKKDMYKII